MVRWSVATLSLLAMSVVKTAMALGTGATYTGSICTGYVDYQVWLPPNTTVAAIEASLVAQGLNATTLTTLSAIPTCKDAFLQYVCSSSYPRISTTPSAGNVYAVQFACLSTCNAVAAPCGPVFAAVGATALLPNCAAAIPGTAAYQPPGIAYQPDGSCNKVSATGSGGSTTSGSNATAGVCPSPFLVDPMTGPGGTTASQTYCMTGCCIPCPAQYQLYAQGSMERGFLVTNTMRAISTVFSFALMVSYLCLRDKRSHPSALILYFAISVFLFSAVVIFPLIDTHGMQCVDAITPSTQVNNTKCAVQGALLIFASMATCCWCVALILNLHLHTVWNSSWFAKKYWLLHLLCWGASLAVAGAALGMKKVQWEFATLCLISQESSSTMFFYPLAALILPGFLIHCATFFHIARISAQAGVHSETMSRSTLSAGAAAVISHRRHVMMAIKIQWRAALMAVWAVLTVTFYWLFYFLQLHKIRPEVIQTHVVEFATCLLSGTAHDTCTERLAPNLPPYILMMAAEFAVSTIGTVIFLVFFKASLWHEWKEWFSGLGWFVRGRNQSKKEQDQFFVI